MVECKLRRGELERTVTEGVTQTRGYMDRCGAEAGHLIVFDRAPERTWAEKVFRRDPAADGTPVTVWGDVTAANAATFPPPGAGCPADQAYRAARRHSLPFELTIRPDERIRGFWRTSAKMA